MFIPRFRQQRADAIQVNTEAFYIPLAPIRFPVSVVVESEHRKTTRRQMFGKMLIATAVLSKAVDKQYNRAWLCVGQPCLAEEATCAAGDRVPEFKMPFRMLQLAFLLVAGEPPAFLALRGVPNSST